MTWWMWVAGLVLLSAIMIPIKLRILKSMMEKKNKSYDDEE